MLWPSGTLCPGKTAPMEKSVTHVLQAERGKSLVQGGFSSFLTANGKAEVKSLREGDRRCGALMSVSQREAKGTCGFSSEGHKRCKT